MQAYSSELEERYGVVDETWAEQYGNTSKFPTLPATSYPASMDSGPYALVLYGGHPERPIQPSDESPGKFKGIPVPAGGCVGEWLTRVSGRLDSEFTLGKVTKKLINDQGKNADEDALWGGLLSDWRACMRKSQLGWTEPPRPAVDASREAGEEERADARLSAKCLKRTDFLQRADAIRSADEIKIYMAHKIAVDRDIALKHRWLKSSWQIIDSQRN